MNIDKLIVMDDVSEIADKSDDFVNVFTVSRKHGITCVNNQNWKGQCLKHKYVIFFLDQFILALWLEAYLPLLAGIKTLTYLKEIS